MGGYNRFLNCHIFMTFFLSLREDPLDLEKDAQHIMRYSAVAPLLVNNSVALI